MDHLQTCQASLVPYQCLFIIWLLVAHNFQALSKREAMQSQTDQGQTSSKISYFAGYNFDLLVFHSKSNTNSDHSYCKSYLVTTNFHPIANGSDFVHGCSHSCNYQFNSGSVSGSRYIHHTLAIRCRLALVYTLARGQDQ